jgi:hypothetical protein
MPFPAYLAYDVPANFALMTTHNVWPSIEIKPKSKRVWRSPRVEWLSLHITANAENALRRKQPFYRLLLALQASGATEP